MKILFLDTPAFAKSDMIAAFESHGIQCDLFFHEDYNDRRNPDFEQQFDIAAEKDNYDFVFSFNYFPIVSVCCMKHQLRYVAYIYDSPLVSLYSYTLINPCNYVFTFDKATYLSFQREGISTVYYLPMAANVKRLSTLTQTANIPSEYKSEVSFVGSMYTEEHNLFDRLVGLPDYTRGYLDGIMQVQQKIYGKFFIEELLNEQILKDMSASVEYQTQRDSVESPAYVYANYFIARKITARERHDLLSAVSERFPLKLFSPQPDASLPHATYMGTVDYYNQMPLVFRHSKINLNISLKSIQTGIPLRGMDILGAGGFLLSNFQSDFLDYFVPGEDFDYYESEEDLLQKIDYYLSHDDVRAQMTQNALGKMTEYHTYEHRVEEILATLDRDVRTF